MHDRRLRRAGQPPLLRRAFTVLRARYPEVRAVVWFNEQYDAASTWPIDSSPTALRAFREAVG